MYSTIFLIFVAVSSLVALQNWRLGLLLCIIVGILQDPVRKITPNTPIYLTLSFVPIYVAMFVNLYSTNRVLPTFFRHHPRAVVLSGLLMLTLGVSSAQTLTYGPDAWQAIVLGLSFYLGWIPAMFLGYFFLRRDYRELDRPLMVFGIITSLMLTGTLLEYVGFKFSAPLLGMVAYKGNWYRFNTDGSMVAMISGFYRAPEVMAWHAATMVIISIYLFVRRPAWAALWIPMAAWGMICVLFGGRRKMFIMVLIFAGVFALLSEGRRRFGVIFYLLLAAVLLTSATSYFVSDRYLDSAESSFSASAKSRISGHAFQGPLWLSTIVGPFGYGVGTRSQGAQHLNLEMDVPLMEGGFEKVMVELGLVGTLVLIAFVAFVIRNGVQSFRNVWASRLDSTPVAGLAAFLIANAFTYLVAFQVYGDPFIGLLLGFALGLLFSSSRLVALEQLRPAPLAVARPRRSPAALAKSMLHR